MIFDDNKKDLILKSINRRQTKNGMSYDIKIINNTFYKRSEKSKL